MGRDCRFRIVEASKDKDGEPTFTPKQAGILLDEIREAAIKNTTDGTDITDAVVSEIAAMKVRRKVAGDIQKRNAALNLLKDRKLKIKRDDLIAEGLTPRKALEAIFVGVQGAYKAGRHSLDAKTKAVHGWYFGDAVKRFEEDNLLRIVNDKSMHLEIEEEIFALGAGKGGVTGSKEALQIAKIMTETNEAIRLRGNRAGGNAEKLDTFSVSQTHNPSKMRRNKAPKWKQDIAPFIDAEKTYQGANPDEFLQSVYDVQTTGVSLKTKVDEGLFEFKGPQNLAKKISRSRVIHFKSAKAAAAYREMYGSGDLMEGFMRDIESNSRNIALMEELGTNPDAMFDKLLKDTKEKFRGDEVKFKGLYSERGLRNMYAEVSGKMMIPENPTGAVIGSAARALQSMSKLGGTLITSLGDIPLKAAELQFQGHSILGSYGTTFGDIRVHGTEKKQVGALIGVGLDGQAGSIASRWTADDDLPGAMSKLQRLFFKMNGLQWWTDSHKRGMGMAMSHRLVQLKRKSFDQLDVDTKRVFGNFEINGKDWDIIRNTATKEADGREYITPDALRYVDGLSEAKKEVLEGKLRAYFIDRVDAAVLTPDARERAIVTQGLQRGTVWGETVRAMMQFKSFPITVISKVYGRALYGKGKADVPAMVQTAIMTTLMGYAAMSGKDLLKGREPRPLDNPATWEAAFLQGGGAGIIGDYLFGEYNRFGQDLTTSLAGPTFGTLNDLAKLYSAAKSGDDLAAKSLKFTMSNMPFANLFYLRPVLNHMFLYQLQEAANPGYLRRMERRIEKQNNQKFLIKPSSAVQ